MHVHAAIISYCDTVVPCTCTCVHVQVCGCIIVEQAMYAQTVVTDATYSTACLLCPFHDLQYQTEDLEEVVTAFRLHPPEL